MPDLFTIIIIVVTIAGGIWAGFAVPPSVRSGAILAALGILFLVMAVLVYSWHCDASIADILLFRDVPGQRCQGRYIPVAYIFLFAGLLGIVRALLTKRRPDDSRSDTYNG